MTEASSPDPAPVEGDVDPLELAWSKVEAEWDDDDAHKRFLGLCVALGRLPEAGGRYRKVREQDASPARREQANQRIEDLLSLAMKTMETLRSPEEPPDKSRLFFIALGVASSIVLLAVWAFVSAG
jgi:hypothetical protein